PRDGDYIPGQYFQVQRTVSQCLFGIDDNVSAISTSQLDGAFPGEISEVTRGSNRLEHSDTGNVNLAIRQPDLASNVIELRLALLTHGDGHLPIKPGNVPVMNLLL